VAVTNFDQRGQSVLNQYNAETINVLVSQSQVMARILWRPLESVNYPVREDSSGLRQLFSRDLFKSLIQTFEGKGYKRFTAIFDPKQTIRDGQQFFLYSFHCHEVGFSSLVRTLGRDRILLIQELQKKAKHEQAQIITKIDEDYRVLFGPWRLSGRIDFNRPGLLEFVYDPDGKALSVNSKDELSLDPADYDHHLKTTSEMLAFVAAGRRPAVFAYFGDISFINNDWSLLKLVTYCMDHKGVDLEYIKINSGDYEQWDYRNPELEAELAGRTNEAK
jgi:hypothetical protein